jgi:hypothetical protein
MTDLQELAEKILEHEGLGYAVLDYFSPKEVASWEGVPDSIKESWFTAAKHLKVVETFFESHL